MGNDEFKSPWEINELNYLINKALAIRKELANYLPNYDSLSLEEKSAKESECLELLKFFNYEIVRCMVYPGALIAGYNVEEWDVETADSNYYIKLSLRQSEDPYPFELFRDLSLDLYVSLQGLKTLQKQHNEPVLDKLQQADKVIESVIKNFRSFLDDTTDRSNETEEYPESIIDEPFIHSPGFSSVNKKGKIFELTPQEAQVIGILYYAYKMGFQYVTLSHLVEEVAPDTSSRKFKDIFRDKKAKEALIENGKRRGSYRLKP